jgi:ribosomal protein L14E/L6E/L27E
MRKPKEIEELIKRAIRDEIALYPLKSVAQIRNSLYRHGYQSLRGELDWHYVSRLLKKVRIENLEELSTQSRTERLVNLKERHRLITQKLATILNGESGPTFADRIAAANSILKWDMALYFAEESTQQVAEIEQKQEVVVLYKESRQIRSRNATTLPHQQNPTQQSRVVPASIRTLAHPQ